MSERLNRLYILLLAILRPVTLFHRINQLPWYRSTLQNWVDELDYQTGDAVLEVGCATGLLSGYLAKTGVSVDAVDKSSAMIRQATKFANGDVNFRQADIMSLPFPDNRFDLVVSASVINVVDEPATAIEELLRVCIPNGTISILIPSSKMDATRFNELFEGLNLNGFSATALHMWNKMAKKMDGDELVQIFRQLGLSDVQTTEYLDGLVIGIRGCKVE